MSGQVPPRDGEGDRAKRGGGGPRFTRRPQTYTARKLRKEMTLPEGMLWKRLRGKQLGLKFRSQHPIGPYVVDFYCATARLVVEVDGMAHDNAERAERDRVRDGYLIEHGYEVLRLPAADVLKDVDCALAAIVARAESPLHRAGGTVPLPASGEALG
ncbi:MAG: hypothetical protein B7Z08_04465 [Sphingomonadales bacterium 32-68-7]|nr:MAG: hypothetical protein B7Z33_04890 [Sphingomonadales bacterium 12-68-11]OYX09674.1 MAG: hypothetical protein B7Z08_04465 [Sphingomonadales bacterium 32-68-7]